MQSCAVIGCGPAGMVASTVLRQSGLMVTCFELEAKPGGIWSFNSRDLLSDRGAVSPVYPTMRCVLPKDLMSFSDVRFDFTVPQFPHHTSMQHYLDTYAQRKGVLGLTRFNTKVESVRMDDKDGMWKLITVNIVNGDVMEWSFDKVCVCTGQTQQPRLPEDLKESILSAFLAAGGDIYHAAHVKDFRFFNGKRVVVLGDGVSAYDYCSELQRCGADVYHSTTLGQGLSFEDGRQYYPTFPPSSPTTVTGKASKKTGEHASLGTLPAADWATTMVDAVARLAPGQQRGAHRTNELIRRWLRYRTLQLNHVPRVGYPKGSEGKGILFASDATATVHVEDMVEEARHRALSGERANHAVNAGDVDKGIFVNSVDAVICATGYTQRYPFLHSDLRVVLEGTRPLLSSATSQASKEGSVQTADTKGLYLGTMWTANPSLAFVGMQKEMLPPLLLMEAQSRFVAYAFTERVKLPSTPQALREAETALIERNSQLTDLYSSTGLGLHSAAYFNVLQQQLGVSSRETYGAMVLRRKWWALASSTLRAYHKVRSMAPLKRKKQHLLFSNKV